MTAASYARTIGANDRINVGLIGCGGRGNYIVQNMLKPHPNTALVAVCDIWKQRRESYPDQAEKTWGSKPKAHADYRELLENPDLDAVIIATPDHQHSGQTIDAVKAGKHVYVEKPIIGIAEDLDVLNKLYETVTASKLAVQHGTHGVSGPAAQALKQFIAEGKLG
jgi:predicted dehydrogenase